MPYTSIRHASHGTHITSELTRINDTLDTKETCHMNQCVQSLCPVRYGIKGSFRDTLACLDGLEGSFDRIQGSFDSMQDTFDGI